MTTTQILLAGWIAVGTVVGALVRRGPLVKMIRVQGHSSGSQRDKEIGGYVFTIRKCTPSSMVLGRHGNHIDAINAEIVDGTVIVRWDESNLTDVTHATEDRYWIRRRGR